MVKKKPHLLDFYGVDCAHCDQMEPLIQRLKEETGLTFRKFEVWYNLDNLKLLQTLDKHNVCGGVPYFYNKKTRGWICGATTYANFKAFATGKAHDHFLSPPTEETDFMTQFRGFFDRIKSEGLEQMKKRLEAGRQKAGEQKEKDGEKRSRQKQAAEKKKRAFVFHETAIMPQAKRSVVCRRPISARFLQFSMSQPF